MTRDDIINKAKSYVKETKYPNPNQFTKFQFKDNLPHAWCGAYIHYIFKHDLGCDWLEDCSNFGYVPTIEKWAKKHGYWCKDYTKAKKGDLVLFSFDLKRPDHLSHVGIVIDNISNGLKTVEGNTSYGKYSDNCCTIKDRDKKYINSVILLPYGGDTMPFNIGDYVYAKNDIKLYTTIEYKESKYTLKTDDKAYVRYIKDNNVALADPVTHDYYPSAWTNELDKLTKEDPTDYKTLYEKERALNIELQNKINKAIEVLNG